MTTRNCPDSRDEEVLREEHEDDQPKGMATLKSIQRDVAAEAEVEAGVILEVVGVPEV